MAFGLKYEPSYAGAKLTAVRDGAQAATGYHDHATVYSVPKGSYYILTGYGWYDGEYTNYLQTTNGMYIPINTLAGNENSWQITTGYTKLPTYSTKQAQSLVDQIMQANRLILCNNLLCARYANKLTQAQRQQVRELQTRLEARNKALQDDNLVQVTETNYPAGYDDLSPYLERLMAGEAIGLAVTTWIVIGCIVVGASVAAYYTYKHFADEAAQDVKYSKELTKILTSKLTEEEYQQLLNETRGIVTKKRIFAALGSLNWKTALIAGAGILGAAILVRAIIRR